MCWKKENSILLQGFHRYDFLFPIRTFGNLFWNVCFLLEKWQLPHGFAVEGAYSLGFDTFVSEKW